MKRKTIFIIIILTFSILIPIPHAKTDGATDKMNVWTRYSLANFEPYNSTGTYDDGQLSIEEDMRLSYFVFPSNIGNDEINLTRLGFKYYKEFNYNQNHTLALYTATGVDNAGDLIEYLTFTLSDTYNEWIYRTLGTEWELNGDFTVYLGVWCESKTGSYQIYFESVGQDYGSLEMAGGYVEPPPDPLVGEARNSTIVYAFRVNYDHRGNTTTTFNQYYGTATDYIARRDYNYTFPSGATNRQIQTLYPRDENLLNISYYDSGFFNQSLTEDQYTDAFYNGTHNLITIPDSTIGVINSTLLRFFTQSNEFNYDLYGPYHENGTRAPAINVTVSHPSITEEFVLDGYLVFGYPTQPTMVSWEFDTGATRHIFLTTSETLYAFLSDETHYVYDFTIKDYTGKLGLNDAYLEIYKTANATEYLIERMIIHDTVNTVPVYLAPGNVYHIKILWADATRYDWGYYVAGSDTTLTISVRDVTFDQQTQMTYKYLRVDVSRPSLTQITVDYEDTLGETNWVNITIQPRSGVVEHSESSNQSVKVFNWLGATNTTNYKVTIYIDHQKFGLKTVVKFADTTETYEEFLNPEVLGTYGALSTGNLIAFSLAVVFMGAFSYQFGSTAGIITGLSIVSLMTFWGATTYSFNFLALCWFVAIIVILRVVKT